MQTLYVDASTWMHRMAPRLKLGALVVLGLLLFLTDNLALLGLAVAIGALLFFSTGLPASEALKRLRPVILTIVVVALFSLIFNPVHVAVVTVLRLTALMLFAAVVTATTSIAAFIDEITALAAPLEKAGLLKAADIGLAVGLVVRFVPEILDRYRAIREAHEARGIKIRFTTALVPLIILTLRDADNIAAAIDARGIRRH
ncbi:MULTISPECIES: energy-coupling factor transporter transmembrane component T family protein [Rhizobium]|uniref:Biotin transport system permease protein n=1 Tax=Rhizobium paranaense TaxID=1650438 RepID=A0A7W9CZF8_9HYPH|nr:MULTISPECIES: energy-coupling factor transporter transmembrane protein EcfT [Rhizobium]MBB5571686.1 biotin transport system permease protein [Rhizobium paranaense]PST64201.1 transporter [Rhizobium sp. SEMIA4064]